MLEGFNISLVSPKSEVLVGLSGGADSVCLLLNLIEIRESMSISVKALHCNHGLREEASSDEEFCRRLCSRLGVPFFAEKINVTEYAEENGMSLEEAGRMLRYRAFEKYTDGLIATAHNKNDNAETVLFNMIRGCTIRGICGIPEKRGNIIRPMINCSRAEIEGYLSEKGQDYVTDKTNLVPDFSRNRLRLNVLPELCEINSAAVENISRLSHSATSDEDFISAEAEKLYDLAERENGLDAETVSKTHSSLRRRVIASFLKKNKISLSQQLIITIEEYIISGSDAKINLSGNVYLRIKSGRISIMECKEEIPDFSAQLSLGENYFPNKKIFAELVEHEKYKKKANVHRKFTNYALDYDKIIGSLLVRNRRSGDRIQLSGRDFTHRVKKLFEVIPKGEKSRLVMLCDDEGVVFVEGFGTGERVKVDSGTKNVLIIGIEED